MNPRKGLLLANILLTVLILGLVAQIVYSRLPGRGQGPDKTISSPEGQVETTPVPSGPQGMTRYQPIVRQDIFDTRIQKKTPPPKPPPPEPEEIEVTRLNLELMGTAVGEAGDSYAVIARGRAPEGEVYRVDDMVQNARLLEILEDRVILEVNGDKQALVLQYEMGPEGSRAGLRAPSAGRSGQDRRQRGFRRPSRLPGT